MTEYFCLIREETGYTCYTSNQISKTDLIVFVSVVKNAKNFEDHIVRLLKKKFTPIEEKGNPNKFDGSFSEILLTIQTELLNFTRKQSPTCLPVNIDKVYTLCGMNEIYKHKNKYIIVLDDIKVLKSAELTAFLKSKMQTPHSSEYSHEVLDLVKSEAVPIPDWKTLLYKSKIPMYNPSGKDYCIFDLKENKVDLSVNMKFVNFPESKFVLDFIPGTDLLSDLIKDKAYIPLIKRFFRNYFIHKRSTLLAINFDKQDMLCQLLEQINLMFKSVSYWDPESEKYENNKGILQKIYSISDRSEIIDTNLIQYYVSSKEGVEDKLKTRLRNNFVIVSIYKDGKTVFNESSKVLDTLYGVSAVFWELISD